MIYDCRAITRNRCVKQTAVEAACRGRIRSKKDRRELTVDSQIFSQLIKPTSRVAHTCELFKPHIIGISRYC